MDLRHLPMRLVAADQLVLSPVVCKSFPTYLSLQEEIMAIQITTSVITISHSAHRLIHMVSRTFTGSRHSNSSSSSRKHRYTMVDLRNMVMLELDHISLCRTRVINRHTAMQGHQPNLCRAWFLVSL